MTDRELDFLKDLARQIRDRNIRGIGTELNNLPLEYFDRWTLKEIEYAAKRSFEEHGASATMDDALEFNRGYDRLTSFIRYWAVKNSSPATRIANPMELGADTAGDVVKCAHTVRRGAQFCPKCGSRISHIVTKTNYIVGVVRRVVGLMR